MNWPRRELTIGQGHLGKPTSDKGYVGLRPGVFRQGMDVEAHGVSATWEYTALATCAL